MQNLGGQTKSIMVFSEVAYWSKIRADNNNTSDCSATKIHPRDRSCLLQIREVVKLAFSTRYLF